MEIVKVCPDINVVLDIDTGLIAEMRKDILVTDLKPVSAEIEQLEKLAIALENSLDPRNAPMKSYAGREGTYKTGGLFQGMFFGFWIALSILMLAVFLIIKTDLSLIGL
ncbi:tetrahydromethanopterin S-methyltransferase subunit B [Methanococcus voltae]|jgi:tetrahydromethanopterin S-methyltransferase subunit B|uniref:Tetrahydromethanopterin S-methyltransferase subunit B n=2 Tax=Methanococcus voltae TaxID=2188 RepID=A0A8J7RZU3_METVO|nr:tetrahydromethanopterin S-methyltransferase subunit B [Methanococcus voltae]MBP2143092.1 tetrahydromethanopterin S-methyltransferase subunit B [Methanococcus voltae]MBP2172203.1 tetrahydromethanopterin S-methyltransferase subunit B [Methanococcus voltae]MBP2200840.1 tetrahydromethanopterin S-methyltransferase subunit B [Methanococcus voltae]MCS3921564.1 tetrahydromethanopterin S-methyltransferase subunit B [Methanococcus voltae PS]